MQTQLLLATEGGFNGMSSPQREVVLLGRLIHHVPAYGATNCGLNM